MTTLPEHLFVSSTDGALYDTRKPNWHSGPPVRPVYERHFLRIENAQQFKATLRAGRGVWPGGYEIAFICEDGGLLCYDCAKKHARHIIDSLRKNSRDGWKVSAMTYEAVSADCTREACGEPGNDLISYCDQCNKEFGEFGV